MGCHRISIEQLASGGWLPAKSLLEPRRSPLSAGRFPLVALRSSLLGFFSALGLGLGSRSGLSLTFGGFLGGLFSRLGRFDGLFLDGLD